MCSYPQLVNRKLLAARREAAARAAVTSQDHPTIDLQPQAENGDDVGSSTLLADSPDGAAVDMTVHADAIQPEHQDIPSQVSMTALASIRGIDLSHNR